MDNLMNVMMARQNGTGLQPKSFNPQTAPAAPAWSPPPSFSTPTAVPQQPISQPQAAPASFTHATTPPAEKRFDTAQQMIQGYQNNWQPNPMLTRILGNQKPGMNDYQPHQPGAKPFGQRPPDPFLNTPRPDVMQPQPHQIFGNPMGITKPAMPHKPTPDANGLYGGYTDENGVRHSGNQPGMSYMQ